MVVAAAGASVSPGLGVLADGRRPEVPMLQTAAALDNLMVGVYTSPAAQRLVADAGSPFLVTFFARLVEQHIDHARRLNQVATQLGGRAQSGIESAVYEEEVVPVFGSGVGLPGLLAVATRLEEIAMQTHVRFAAVSGDTRSVGAHATIGPVEAQHGTVLELARQLLAEGLPLSRLELPLELGQLPAGSGAAALGGAVESLDSARPPAEGAVTR